jgi:hypothetical protein
MKKLLICLILGLSCFVGAQTKDLPLTLPKEEVPEVDSVRAQQLLKSQRDQAIVAAKINEIVAKYQQALLQDSDYQAALDRNKALTKEINDEIQAIQGKAGRHNWKFDPNTITFSKVVPEEPKK